MARTKWPDEVPVLEAADICFEKLDSKRGTHCLVGWSGEVFRHLNYMVPPAVERAIESAAREIMPGLLETLINKSVHNINDCCGDAEKVARIWNRAMCKLGYTEGNPEAKHLKKK